MFKSEYKKQLAYTPVKSSVAPKSLGKMVEISMGEPRTMHNIKASPDFERSKLDKLSVSVDKLSFLLPMLPVCVTVNLFLRLLPKECLKNFLSPP